MTNNILIYYYAEQIEGNAAHSGSHEHVFDSRTLKMFEARVRKDENGDVDFGIVCKSPFGSNSSGFGW